MLVPKCVQIVLETVFAVIPVPQTVLRGDVGEERGFFPHECGDVSLNDVRNDRAGRVQEGIARHVGEGDARFVLVRFGIVVDEIEDDPSAEVRNRIAPEVKVVVSQWLHREPHWLEYGERPRGDCLTNKLSGGALAESAGASC